MSKKEPQMQPCKTCGQNIAASAKACPHCGAKNKKKVPIAALVVWIIVAIIFISIIGGGSSDSSDSGNDMSEASVSATTKPSETPKATPTTEPSPAPIEYTVYTVDEMVDILETNALKAETTFNDQYVEITGMLSNIDSDGKYISIKPKDGRFTMISVQCYIKTDEQKMQVIEMAIDDTVTVRGRITRVGEVLGYSLNIDEIVE